MVPIETEKRVNWHRIRAEYINGVSQRKLAEKYHLSRTSIANRCRLENWSEARHEARARIEQSVIQKTAEKAADNATLAADIKRKGLLILNKLFDDYMEVSATERTVFGRDELGNSTRDIKKLRDLTAAFKDLTDDVAGTGGEANELLRSLMELEKRSGQ